MEEIRIIIRDDYYIRLQAPLSFAYDYVQKGLKVDVLFLNMSLLALTKEGVKSVRVDGRHSDKEPCLREQLAKAGATPDVHDFLKEIKQTGQVILNG